MVCCPDLMALYQAGNLSMEGVKAVQLAMIAHCENLKDRFAILDCPPGLSPQQIKDWRMNEAGYDTKYGAVYYFAILDCPPGLSPQQIKDWRMNEAGYDTKYGGVVFTKHQLMRWYGEP